MGHRNQSSDEEDKKKGARKGKKKDSARKDSDRKKKDKKDKDKKKKDIYGRVRYRREAIQRSAKDMRRAPQLQFQFRPGDPLARTDPFRLEVDGSNLVTQNDQANITQYKEARRQQLELEKARVHAHAVGQAFNHEDDLANARRRANDAFEKFAHAEQIAVIQKEAEDREMKNKRKARKRIMEHERRMASEAAREANEDWQQARELQPLIQQREDAAINTRDIERGVTRFETFGRYSQAAADELLNHQAVFRRAQDLVEERRLPNLPVTSYIFPRRKDTYQVKAPDGTTFTLQGKYLTGKPDFFGTDYDQFHDRAASKVESGNRPPPPPPPPPDEKSPLDSSSDSKPPYHGIDSSSDPPEVMPGSRFNSFQSYSRPTAFPIPKSSSVPLWVHGAAPVSEFNAPGAIYVPGQGTTLPHTRLMTWEEAGAGYQAPFPADYRGVPQQLPDGTMGPVPSPTASWNQVPGEKVKMYDDGTLVDWGKPEPPPISAHYKPYSAPSKWLKPDGEGDLIKAVPNEVNESRIRRGLVPIPPNKKWDQMTPQEKKSWKAQWAVWRQLPPPTPWGGEMGAKMAPLPTPMGKDEKEKLKKDNPVVYRAQKAVRKERHNIDMRLARHLSMTDQELVQSADHQERAEAEAKHWDLLAFMKKKHLRGKFYMKPRSPGQKYYRP
jgi:hypothetical protein